MLASLEIQSHAQGIILILRGVWDRSIPKTTLKALNKASSYGYDDSLRIILDSSFDLDFCGGAILLNWSNHLKKSAQSYFFNAFAEHQKATRIFTILQNKTTINELNFTTMTIKAHKDTFVILKKWCYQVAVGLNFIGEILYTLWLGILSPVNFRLRALFFHIQEAAIKAVPIVSLACFLIGIVVAYQGSLQLVQFGASILIVEMSSMLTLREMAPIIVAIIIAGRSASSFSAEIGMMRATQEIDAMRVMGFNPFTFLVLPRIFALVFALPLVVFVADIFGLSGGMFISQVQLGISSEQFLERFAEMVDIHHFWIGILKAPFFGLIISLIGCYHGFITEKDTRSIGVHTTKSVVESIFCEIAFDALCSVLFTQIGW